MRTFNNAYSYKTTLPIINQSDKSKNLSNFQVKPKWLFEYKNSYVLMLPNVLNNFQTNKVLMFPKKLVIQPWEFSHCTPDFSLVSCRRDMGIRVYEWDLHKSKLFKEAFKNNDFETQHELLNQKESTNFSLFNNENVDTLSLLMYWTGEIDQAVQDKRIAKHKMITEKVERYKFFNWLKWKNWKVWSRSYMEYLWANYSYEMLVNKFQSLWLEYIGTIYYWVYPHKPTERQIRRQKAYRTRHSKTGHFGRFKTNPITY